MLCLLREDEVVVDRHLEDAAVALHQLGVQPEALLDLGRQTDGPRFVVSTDAVLNDDLMDHGHIMIRR